jgi:hypothetical protein
MGNSPGGLSRSSGDTNGVLAQLQQPVTKMNPITAVKRRRLLMPIQRRDIQQRSSAEMNPQIAQMLAD